MPAIASLVIDIAANIAKLEQDMAKAQGTVDRAMAGITTAANLAKTALGALGVGASVAGLTSFVNGTAEAIAKLKTLSEQAGTTVEAMSGLRSIAKYADTDMETVAAGLQKLSKAMLEASDGTGKQARAFESLGVSVKTATGQLRPSEDVLKDVAAQMVQMDNATQRVALAQEMFGKAGAQLIPFLLELGKAGELNAKITTEQAEAAKQYEDNLKRLAASSQAWKTELVNGLIPSLNELIERLLTLKSLSLDQLFGKGGPLTGRQYAEPLTAITELEQKLKSLQATRDALGANGFKRVFNADDIAVVNSQIKMIENELRVLRDVSSKQIAKLPGLTEPPGSKTFALPGGEGAAEKDHRDAMRNAEEQYKREQEIQDEADKYTRKYYADLEKADEAYRAEVVKNAYEQAEAEQKIQEEANAATVKYYRDLEREQEKDAKEFSAYLRSLAREVKTGKDYAAEFGLVMTSSLESMIVKAQDARSVINALIADLAKMVIRQTVTAPMASLVSRGITALGTWAIGAFGSTAPVTSDGWVSAEGGTGYSTGMTGAAPRAGGGPVSANSLYMVGEEGPELFVPGASGSIVPHGALGGTTVHQTVVVQTGVQQTVRAELAAFLPQLIKATRFGVVAARKQGGAMAREMG